MDFMTVLTLGVLISILIWAVTLCLVTYLFVRYLNTPSTPGRIPRTGFDILYFVQGFLASQLTLIVFIYLTYEGWSIGGWEYLVYFLILTFPYVVYIGRYRIKQFISWSKHK